MNFFKKIFSKSTTKKSVSDEQFITLAKLIVENETDEVVEKYLQKLADYKTHPETIFINGEYFYDTKIQELEVYRGDGAEIKEGIQWFLLIDTLGFDNFIWELDWKSDWDEIYGLLRILSEKKHYELPDLTKVKNLKKDFLNAYFADINIELAKNNLTLFELYIDSDSYVIAMVKLENINNIVSKAQACGHKIVRHG